MTETAKQVEQARKSGDADDLASALILHANTLTQKGDFSGACALLDEAAGIHKTHERVYDEARCSHMSATLYRLAGDLTTAKQRAQYALKLPTDNLPIKVSTHTEIAEIALAENNAKTAAEAYGIALELGRQAGLKGEYRAELLRKRAIALAHTGSFSKSINSLDEAKSLHWEAGNTEKALRTLIEAATVALQSGDKDLSKKRIDHLLELAEREQDFYALADTLLLKAAEILETQQPEEAKEFLLEARDNALRGVAPLPYISASFALSELAEVKGDLYRAYEYFAVGWVTLSDLLGKEQAKATYEPKLIALRERWGVELFNKIKKQYEDNRRARESETSN